MVVIGFGAIWQCVGELNQLGRRWLHSEGVLLGIEILKGNRIADEDMRKLAS